MRLGPVRLLPPWRIFEWRWLVARLQRRRGRRRGCRRGRFGLLFCGPGGRGEGGDVRLSEFISVLGGGGGRFEGRFLTIVDGLVVVDEGEV